MEFRVLGVLEVHDELRVIEVRPAKLRMLLAMLVLHPNEVVPVDRLTEALWGEEPPASAANTLQGYVSHLRAALEPGRRASDSRILRTQSPGYLLAVDPGDIDARRFEHLAAQGRKALSASDFEGATELLADALALWRGPALSEFVYEQFAQPSIRRLEERRLGAIEDRVDARLGLGQHHEIVGDLQSLVAHHPLRERLRGQLMVALYRCGRQAAALEAFQDLRTVLGEELGIAPGPEVSRLEEAILLHRPELEWRSRPVAEQPASATAVVQPQPPPRPAPASSFVGRERELATVRELLATTRLLTLTGAGGCGKTRLALEAATRHGEGLAGPVFVVELGPLLSAPSIVAALAAAVGVREQPGRSLVDTTRDRLGAVGTLLVLDNCEHLLDDVAEVVGSLLAGCRHLTILATSREPLNLTGETTWRVPSLGRPADGPTPSVEELESCEAVRLFVVRAAAATPEFRLTADNAAAVAQLCRRLDGMPLALELAAARTRTLSVRDLADRLDDRFRVLGAGARGAPPRHQTLEAAIDWSYELLADEERVLLARLAAFTGQFTLAAVEAVCGDPPLTCVAGVLSALVDKSLVVLESSGGGGEYRLLETVRQYAGERLQEIGGAPAVRARHAAYHLAVAEAATEGLKGHDVEQWIHRLDREMEDIRAASRFLTEQGRAEDELRIVGALLRYFHLKGQYQRASEWLRDALLAAPDAPAPVRAMGSYGLGALSLFRCRYEEASALCTEALGLFRGLGDGSGAARSLTILGSVARERGRYDDALALHDQALRIFDELGDSWSVAHCLQLAGLASWLSGDFHGATERSERSLALFQEHGDTTRMAWAHVNLAAVELYVGDPCRAETLLGDSLALFRRVGYKEGIGWALDLLGAVALRRGDPDLARGRLTESLDVHVELGDRWREASVLESLATVASVAGDVEGASRFLGRAEALRGAIGVPVPACERPGWERTRAAVRARAAGTRPHVTGG